MTAKEIHKETKEKMKDSVQALAGRYSKMRGGRARADLVSEVKVECYGSRMSLEQLASISIPEPRLLIIEPWDKSILKNVEKAILTSDLGINPSNDGNVIRLAVPPLTEERRKGLAKITREWAEEVRVSIRNLRREARTKIEDLEKRKEISEDEEKRAEKDIQSLTDDFVSQIDKMQKTKAEQVSQI